MFSKQAEKLLFLFLEGLVLVEKQKDVHRIYLRKPRYEGVYIGRRGSLFDLLLSDLPAVISVRNVLSQGAVKQHGLLGYDTYLRAQPVDVELFGVVIVQHLAI